MTDKRLDVTNDGKLNVGKVKVGVMSERIIGLDFARALAVFSMVLVNFNVAMGVKGASGWLVDLVALFEGRAAALFVILAGVGISLLTKKARLSGESALIRKQRISLLKRAGLLIVVGLSYSTIWQADILHFYGLYIAVAALLFNVSNRVLMICAVGFVINFILLLLFFDYDAGWDWENLVYVDFWTIEGLLRHMFFNGFHPVFPWCAFLLFGMWLGRLDLSNAVVRRKLLICASIIWLLTELLSKLLVFAALAEPTLNIPEVEVIALLGTAPIPPMPQYILAASSLATVVIVLCVIIAERFSNQIWVTALVKTGQLSLTFYVAHVLFGMGTLEAIGKLENQTVEFIVLVTALFNLCCVVFACLWTSLIGRGPLEWVFRRLAG